jgi:hypothetical protein
MFGDKIRSLLAEFSANWLKLRKTPATSHKGTVAANDTKKTKGKRPRKRSAHKAGKPVDRASNM